jgi:hypothetical protein
VPSARSPRADRRHRGAAQDRWRLDRPGLSDEITHPRYYVRPQEDTCASRAKLAQGASAAWWRRRYSARVCRHCGGTRCPSGGDGRMIIRITCKHGHRLRAGSPGR